MNDVVYVALTRDLVHLLEDWSGPVQVRVEKCGNEYMIAVRSYPQPVDKPVDNPGAFHA